MQDLTTGWVRGPLIRTTGFMPARLSLALAAALAFALAAAPALGQVPASAQEGDIIFQASQSGNSLAIQRATGSRYNHMGIIFMRNRRPWVFEANATVRYTPLAEWIARGESAHYVLKRLRDAKTRLTPAKLRALRGAAVWYSGRRYDLWFGWSDDRIYCSELVWKIYQRALGIRIGELQKLRSFKLDDPAVQEKLRQRYGRRIPLEEPVISPQAMFGSRELVTVESN
jgi:hypothetical protein